MSPIYIYIYDADLLTGWLVMHTLRDVESCFGICVTVNVPLGSVATYPLVVVSF
jgi:hypothetical protein